MFNRSESEPAAIMKDKLKIFFKEKFNLQGLQELFPDKKLKSFNVNIYTGPLDYPGHGINPDYETIVVTVEFNDDSRVSAKFVNEISPQSKNELVPNHE